MSTTCSPEQEDLVGTPPINIYSHADETRDHVGKNCFVKLLPGGHLGKIFLFARPSPTVVHARKIRARAMLGEDQLAPAEQCQFQMSKRMDSFCWRSKMDSSFHSVEISAGSKHCTLEKLNRTARNPANLTMEGSL